MKGLITENPNPIISEAKYFECRIIKEYVRLGEYVTDVEIGTREECINMILELMMHIHSGDHIAVLVQCDDSSLHAIDKILKDGDNLLVQYGWYNKDMIYNGKIMSIPIDELIIKKCHIPPEDGDPYPINYLTIAKKEKA